MDRGTDCVWAKARSEKTWGPEGQLRGRAGKASRTSGRGERSRRTQQRGSCEAILEVLLGADGITGCGGRVKRKNKVGARLVSYLMSEQKREMCRDTATQAKIIL